MAPVNNFVTTQLRQLIYYHLDCHLYANALFFAGRLHAYEPRASEAAYLISLCHLRLGQLKAAYDYAKSSGSRGTHLGCSYIFAQACLGLEKHGEGITALERSKSLWAARSNWNKHSEQRRQQLPDAAAVYCLLGKLSQAHEDRRRAIDAYVEALRVNPFMWDAFTRLCDLGVEMRVPNIFRMTREMTSSIANGGSEEAPLGSIDDNYTQNLTSQQNVSQPSGNDPFSVSTHRANGDSRAHMNKAALYEKLNGSTNIITPNGNSVGSFEGTETPTAFVGSVTSQLPKAKDVGTALLEDGISIEPPQAPVRKGRVAGALGGDYGMEAPPRMKPSSIRSEVRLNGDAEDVDASNFSLSSMLPSGITDRKRTVSGQVPQASASSTAAHVNGNHVDPSAPQRRSVRILNSITRPQSKLSSTTAVSSTREGRELKKAKATGTKGRAAHTTVGRVVSGNRKNGDPMDVDGKEVKAPHANVPVPTSHKTTNADKIKEHESLTWLLELFTKLGTGYYSLSHFRCDEAIQSLNSLSIGQRETPWVLAQLGRAFFEQSSYSEAEKYFARIKTMAPSRLEDMEVYSTVLWHLKRDVDLSFLAHELVDIDRLSPQAWCAVGNSFSLQRDHDNAIRCFKRATQLEPQFAYAFTLQGHEHVSNEEYDKATSSFRAAIAAEKRHYNAWYGLGRVYERQGKYDVAEHHYRVAADINPTNTILICNVGMVLERLNRPQAALDSYVRCCELNPRYSLARFKKARVLMVLGAPERALPELLVCKDMVPDEANVHFLLGRAYKTLRQKANAIKHFTTALNLDPKVHFWLPVDRVDWPFANLTAAGIPAHQSGYGADGRPGRGRWDDGLILRVRARRRLMAIEYVNTQRYDISDRRIYSWKWKRSGVARWRSFCTHAASVSAKGVF